MRRASLAFLLGSAVVAGSGAPWACGVKAPPRPPLPEVQGPADAGAAGPDAGAGAPDGGAPQGGQR